MTSQKSTKGLYVAASFSDETNQKLADFVKQHNIPNAVKETSFHTTIVYSRVEVPNFRAQPELDINIRAGGYEYECWDTDDGKCLVLRVRSPYLQIRFAEAMAAGATYDFEEYKPHVTLSYDIGDMDWENLPTPDFNLNIVRETSEELDLEWTDS